MTNVNCLQGITCPLCGNDAIVNIEIKSLAAVTDEGAETFGDMEWDGDSFAECPECDYCGTLAEFRTEATNHDSTNEEK